MKVVFEFECGKTTCAVEPGKFCMFLGTRRFGTEYWCMPFGVKLWDQGGNLLRCPECLAWAKEK